MDDEDPHSRPPKSIPYLVSTLGDIMRQQTLVDVHKARWLATYPTSNGTHEAKVEWLKNIEGGKDVNCLYDVKDALKEILSETVRSPVCVQLLVRKDNGNVMRAVGERVLGVSNIYNGGQNRMANPVMLVVAQDCVNVGTRSDMLVPKLLEKAGFPVDATVRCAPPKGGLQKDTKFNEEWPEFVEEGVHFPLGLPQNLSAIAFEVVDVNHTLPPYERALHLLAHKYATQMPAFVLVQKDGVVFDSKTLVPMEATHDAIWYCERIEFERCRWHVRTGLGETDEIRRTLAKGGVPAAKIRLNMVHGEVNYVKRIGGAARWRRKLATLLALTLEIRRDLDFVKLAGRPRDAAKILQELSEQWRTKVLVGDGRSDMDLGLCIGGHKEMGRKSRAALLVLLKRIQAVVEKTVVPNSNVKISFSCIPRNRTGKPNASTAANVLVGGGAQNVPLTTRPTNIPSTTPMMVGVQKPTGTLSHITPKPAGVLKPSPTGQRIMPTAGGVVKPVTTVPLMKPVVGGVVKSTTSIPLMTTIAGNVMKSTAVGQRQVVTGVVKPTTTAPTGMPGMVNAGGKTLPNTVKPGVTGVQAFRGTIPSNPVRLLPPNVALAARTMYNKRPIPGAAKPAGRTPNDSKGTPMKWDSTVGLWRSISNPAETKMSNVKLARTGMEGMMEVGPKVSSPAAVTTTPMVIFGPGRPTGMAPMEVDTEKASGPTPMAVEKKSETLSKASAGAVLATGAKPVPNTGAGVVLAPGAKPAPIVNTSVVLASGAKPVPNVSTGVVLAPGAKPVPNVSAGAVLAPGAKPVPNVSAGVVPPGAKLVSNSNVATTAGSSVLPPGMASASAPLPPELIPKMPTGVNPVATSAPTTSTAVGVTVTSSGLTATPKAQTTVVNSVLVGATNGKALPVSTVPTSSALTVGNPVNVAAVQTLKSEVNPSSGAHAPGGVTNGTTPMAGSAQDSRNSSARPAGRAPHDRAGQTMTWDGPNSVWRSVVDPNETRTPNLRPMKLVLKSGNPLFVEGVPTVSVSKAAAAGAPLQIPVVPPLAVTAPPVPVPPGVAGSQSVSPRSSRPVGRAPNDSSGSPMTWDAGAGVWRSTSVANEIKRPRLKPVVTNVFPSVPRE